MAIRTKKYRHLGTNQEVRATKITEKNFTDLVAYICRNGGGATGHLARPQFKRPARIRIKQLTFGHGWSKNDWRVALLGDWIVRNENNTFERVKADDFDRRYVAI